MVPAAFLAPAEGLARSPAHVATFSSRLRTPAQGEVVRARLETGPGCESRFPALGTRSAMPLIQCGKRPGGGGMRSVSGTEALGRHAAVTEARLKPKP